MLKFKFNILQLLISVTLFAVPLSLYAPDLRWAPKDPIDKQLQYHARIVLVLSLLGIQVVYWLSVVPIFKKLKKYYKSKNIE